MPEFYFEDLFSGAISGTNYAIRCTGVIHKCCNWQEFNKKYFKISEQKIEYINDR